jgi:NADP-dependent aldehyde dehydrogenase
MKLAGNLLTGAQEVSATAGTMKELNPATNVETEPLFAFGGIEEVTRARSRRRASGAGQAHEKRSTAARKSADYGSLCGDWPRARQVR